MNNKLVSKLYHISILIFLLIALNQCGMGADARKYPPEIHNILEKIKGELEQEKSKTIVEKVLLENVV